MKTTTNNYRHPIIICLAVGFTCLLFGVTSDLLRASDKSGPPSETDIKTLLEKHYYDGTADQTTVTFDTPVKIASSTVSQQRTIVGMTVYPVTVDFTVVHNFTSRTSFDHFTGSSYNFYRDNFGNWQYVTGDIGKSTTEVVWKK